MIYQGDHSVKWYRRTRVVKILLFFAVLLISIVVVSIIRRPAEMDDLSGGIYKETFRTSHVPLQKELRFLHKEGFFDKGVSPRMTPEEFSAWYASAETSRIIYGNSIEVEPYRALIRQSLQNGLERKNLFFGNPLENPIPGDLFRTLIWCFEYDLATENYENCAESLENMFCFSALLLNSNAADIYFVSKSLECALQYEKIFQGNSAALSLWSKRKNAMLGKYLFTADGLYRIERLRRMQDFEMIRQNGVRIYDGKVSGSSQMKEGIGQGSLSRFKEGIFTAVTDFFYDVDRDQTMTLVMLRKLLYEGISPYMMDPPDRKVSIHCYRRICHEAEVLASVLEYLGKRAE